METTIELTAIHKWCVSLSSFKHELTMPRGAVVVALQNQNGVAHIWARVNPKETIFQVRTYTWRQTGERFDGYRQTYIGTMNESGYVFHLFEEVH